MKPKEGRQVEVDRGERKLETNSGHTGEAQGIDGRKGAR